MKQWVKSNPLHTDMGAIAFVQGSQLCAGLNEEILGQLYDSGTVVEAEPGEALIDADGDNDHGLFMVIEGKVAVSRAKEGAFAEIATLERNAIFGEMSVLTRQSSGATISAVNDVRLVHFPADIVRQLADDAPKFGRRLAALMAVRSK